MMYTILVTGPAYGTENASTAFLFSSAVIASQHELLSVFFYCDGVLNANKFITVAKNEFNLMKKWESLYNNHDVKLYVCISAALRRGIVHGVINNDSYSNYTNLSSCFKLVGLSKFSDLIMISDRVIQF